MKTAPAIDFARVQMDVATPLQREVATFLVVAACDDFEYTREQFEQLSQDAKRQLWVTYRRVRELLTGA